MNTMDKSVCVVGLGYIGLPTCAVLANAGYTIHGVDVVQSVVDTINQGKIHIVEPGLEEAIKSAVDNEQLKADLKPTEADVFIIAVPTPFKDDHCPDISYVESATRAIAPYLQAGNLILLESTSPVGTTEAIKNVLSADNVDVGSIHIAHCPERVLPGRIIEELVSNDRIVGGLSKESTQVAAQFYETFVNGQVLQTNAKTAELAKLTENSFRDVNIAFANELSMICDDLDIDAKELIKLANHHPRVNILNPGVGVGGHCIAVDPWFIVDTAGETAKIIRVAREVNLKKTDWVIDKIQTAIDAHEKVEPSVALLGIAYKPDIDDLRESPALEIAKAISKNNSNIAVVEPNVTEHPAFESIAKLDDVSDHDLVFVLVGHSEFADLNSDHVISF